MKTMMFKKGLIAGLLLISTVAMANNRKNSKINKINSEYLEATVTPNQFKKVLVHVYKQKDETVKIKLYDAEGRTIHEDRVSRSTEILRPYDLSGLPLGKYSFEVSNDIYLMRKTVEIK